MLKNWKLQLAIILVIHLFFLLQLKFTAWPEMLSWPYLIARGWLPYQNITIAHTPILVVLLSQVYLVFGAGILQLKVFTWLVILLTDVCVFLVARNLFGNKKAVLAISAYALLQILYDGNGLWFDLLLAPVSLIDFYLFSRKKYLLAGVFWVAMFLTKQTAIWFLLPIIFHLWNSGRKNITDFVKGVFLAVAFLGIILGIFKLLTPFYNWVIYFGSFVLPRAEGQIQLPSLKNLVVAGFPFVVFIPLILKTKSRKINLNSLLWAIAGAMGAYPRFEYFHFQPALPFLAFAAAQVLPIFSGKKRFLRAFVILYMLGFFYLFANFSLRNYKEGVRFYEEDVVHVADYIKNNIGSGEKIFVMNWWDNIYALTDTVPATDPLVPQLSWYQDLRGVQEEEVRDLRAERPKVIILQPYSISGLSSYIPRQIYDYVEANYRLSAKIDGIQILVPKY